LSFDLPECGDAFGRHSVEYGFHEGVCGGQCAANDLGYVPLVVGLGLEPDGGGLPVGLVDFDFGAGRSLPSRWNSSVITEEGSRSGSRSFGWLISMKGGSGDRIGTTGESWFSVTPHRS